MGRKFHLTPAGGELSGSLGRWACQLRPSAKVSATPFLSGRHLTPLLPPFCRVSGASATQWGVLLSYQSSGPMLANALREEEEPSVGFISVGFSSVQDLDSSITLCLGSSLVSLN